MKYLHQATGLQFERRSGANPVHVTGNTYAHRQSLYAAGFRWDDAAKQYDGTIDNVVALNVPRAFEIPAGLGIRVKNKIGGGRVAR